MAGMKLSIEMPRRSLVYLMICGAGILAFILAGIYPSYRNMIRIDASMAGIKAQVDEQKILFPLFQKLRGILTSELSKAQPSPQKSGLPAQRLDDLPTIFGDIAANCGIEFSAVTPDVKSFADDSHFLSVDLALKGDFFKLRRFLLELANLPYLGSIEELQIQEGPQGKEFFLKVWLMIDNPRSSAG